LGEKVVDSLAPSQHRTLGQVARELGTTLRKIDRLAEKYADRLPRPERVGILRVYPVEAVELFRELWAGDRMGVREPLPLYHAPVPAPSTAPASAAPPSEAGAVPIGPLIRKAVDDAIEKAVERRRREEAGL